MLHKHVTPQTKSGIADGEAIVRTFAALARHIYHYGLRSFDEIQRQSDDPLYRKGCELLLHGWDSVLMRSLLERTSSTRRGRACSTCETCSTAGRSWSPWITIAIPGFAGRRRGACSRRAELASLRDNSEASGKEETL